MGLPQICSTSPPSELRDGVSDVGPSDIEREIAPYLQHINLSELLDVVSDVGPSGIERGVARNLQHIDPFRIASTVGVEGPSGIERGLPFAAHQPLELGDSVQRRGASGH